MLRVGTHCFVLFLILRLATSPAIAVEVRFAYGSAPGQVGYANDTVRYLGVGPQPLGPLAFRVDGRDCWLADSVHARLYHVAANGDLADSLLLKHNNEPWLLEDFALTRDLEGRVNGFWVVNGSTQQILHLDRRGRRLRIIGGIGDAPHQFRQIVRLELGASGHLYVGDRGRREIVILRRDGTVVRSLPWSWSGFALDRHENLYTAACDGSTGELHLRVDTSDGRRLHDLVLKLEPHRDPTVWWVARNGEVIMTYVPASGPLEGEAVLARANGLGEILEPTPIRVPLAMNRFLEPARDDERYLWLAVADFAVAPQGRFRIVRRGSP